MKNLLTILVVGISLALKSTAQESKISDSNSQTIKFDPSLAKGGSMTQVFTEINYIPLETTKESLLGDISQLEVTDINFIIYDNDTQCILIFDKSGKYKTKISSVNLTEKTSNSSGEALNGFKLLKSNGEHIIQISFKSKVFNFNTSGKLIMTKKVNDKGPRYISEYNFNDSVKVVNYYSDKKGNEDSLYLFGLLKNDKIIKKYLRIDNKIHKMGSFAVGGPSFIDTDNPDIKYAVKDYDYKIYKITSEGMSVAYNIVFPSINALPKDFSSNKIYNGKQMEYFFKQPNVNKIYGIGYTYEIGNYLYVKCGSLGHNLRQNGSFVYNLKDNSLISLNRLDPDTLSHYLPAISSRWDMDFKKYDSKYLYTCLSSLEMFTYYEQNKSKNYKYPAVIEDYFRTANKKNNPVIVQLKPKTI